MITGKNCRGENIVSSPGQESNYYTLDIDDNKSNIKNTSNCKGEKNDPNGAKSIAKIYKTCAPIPLSKPACPACGNVFLLRLSLYLNTYFSSRQPSLWTYLARPYNS